MVKHDSATKQADKSSRLSYAGQALDLRRNAPLSLRELRALRPAFDNVRCPYISLQLKEQSKTEAQRREESSRGSMMIKLHKPFPELRPKHEQAPIRATFNAAWLKEQRRAQLAQFQDERIHQQEETVSRQERPHKPTERER